MSVRPVSELQLPASRKSKERALSTGSKRILLDGIHPTEISRLKGKYYPVDKEDKPSDDS